MKPGPVEYMAAQARAIAGAFNLLALLASPRVCARLTARGAVLPSPKHVAEHLEELINALDGATFGPASPKNGREVLPSLRALQRIALEGDGRTVALDLQEGARMLLETMGIPEPPEGWDQFEGPAPTEPEPLDPDPRPPPTAEEVAATPDIVRMTRALGWCMVVASPKMIAKIPAAALHRPALAHVDCLLAAYRPRRDNDAKGRAQLLSLIDTVERLRELCERWDGHEAPSREIQRSAQVVLGHGNPDQTPEKCEAFDGDVDPAWLLLPRPS